MIGITVITIYAVLLASQIFGDLPKVTVLYLWLVKPKFLSLLI